LNFGAVFHPNQAIRDLGVHVNPMTQQGKRGLTEPPRVLWKDMVGNFDLIEDIVEEKLCRKDAKKKTPNTTPSFFEKPSKARVQRKIRKLLLRYGRNHCPECAGMSNANTEYHAKKAIIRTLSSGLNRDQMVQYVENKIIHIK
jgi:hypothetical protein